MPFFNNRCRLCLVAFLCLTGLLTLFFAGIVALADNGPRAPDAPTVTLIAPADGVAWPGGQARLIRWTANDLNGFISHPITLYTSYDDGATWTPLATGLANSGSYTWTLPLLNTDRARVRVEATNVLGETSADANEGSFTIDSQPPAAPVNLQAQPSTWSRGPFTLTWNPPTDLSGIAGAYYRFDAPPDAPTDGTWVATTNILSGLNPSGDGIHSVYVWLVDRAGNVNHANRAAVNVQVDRTPPFPPFNMQASPEGWSATNSFSETWSVVPDISGLVGAYYKLGSEPTTPTDGIFVAMTNTLTHISVPQEGRYNLFVWLKDGAGNVDHTTRNVDVNAFSYDATPPTTGLQPSLPPGPGGWYNAPVTITLIATDTLSGVTLTRYRLDGQGWVNGALLTIANEGTHALEYQSQDVAGNVETVRSTVISLDSQPPTTTATIQSTPGPDGWYTRPITITFQATDAASGVFATYYRLNGGGWLTGTQVIVAQDGQHTLAYYSEDGAGNVEAVRLLAFKLDTTPPTTGHTIQGTMGEEGWYVSPITVTLQATDNASGVALTQYSLDGGATWLTGTAVAFVTDTVQTLRYRSTDRVGNVEQARSVDVKIDRQPPGPPTDIVAIPATWSSRNAFGFSWDNPNDLSGIGGVYYKVGAAPDAPTDGTFVATSNTVTNVQATAEGSNTVYLWLKDRAGNVDHRNRSLAPTVLYDATPPTTTLTVTGALGDNNWYTSTVTLHFTSIDNLSGVAFIRYRINGGQWLTHTGHSTTTVYALPGKHTVQYQAGDVAGNMEITRSATVRIDPAPPGAPLNIQTTPFGWSNVNRFRVQWDNPTDVSGIAGVYYKLNAPPTGPYDGAFVATPDTTTIEIAMPSDGQHDLYLWLRDNAGNASANLRAQVLKTFWYDGTPPRTTVQANGTPGMNGWFVSPITVGLVATDATSGVAATWWQLDGGPQNQGTAFAVTGEGPHEAVIYSVDNAGNAEPLQQIPLRVDQRPPTISLLPLLPEYASTFISPIVTFTVQWEGSDPSPGSGIGGYDIQVRNGSLGNWSFWQTNTTATSAPFNGERGRIYQFRARVRDVAGNQTLFPTVGPYVSTYIQSVANGQFVTGNFNAWRTSGILRKSVVVTSGPDGQPGFVARLGTPEYGPNITEPDPGVPVGSATMTQTLLIPPLTDMPHPVLTFWYRVQTYDLIFSERNRRMYDTLDVTIYDTQTRNETLVLRAGNPTQVWGELYDTGWQRAMIDLRPFAGREIVVNFSNWNRHDNLLNTWSFVDDVRVMNVTPMRFPLAYHNGNGGGQGMTLASPPPTLPRPHRD